jgi:hypothetical protein
MMSAAHLLEHDPTVAPSMELSAKFPRLQRHRESRLPPPVAQRVDDLQARLDRALPGRVYRDGSAQRTRTASEFVAHVIAAEPGPAPGDP